MSLKILKYEFKIEYDKRYELGKGEATFRRDSQVILNEFEKFYYSTITNLSALIVRLKLLLSYIRIHYMETEKIPKEIKDTLKTNTYDFYSTTQWLTNIPYYLNRFNWHDHPKDPYSVDDFPSLVQTMKSVNRVICDLNNINVSLTVPNTNVNTSIIMQIFLNLDSIIEPPEDNSPPKAENKERPVRQAQYQNPVDENHDLYS